VGAYMPANNSTFMVK